MTLDPMHQREALAQPYDLAAAVIMGAAFLVSIFYSLDTLYGERRDRSILFWKSLPVSDLTTVLAKATVPLVILPMLAFAITAVTTFVMLILSSLVVGASGQSVASLWAQIQSPTVLLMLLYHLVTIHMLWYAPIYAWMLLVSAWARRAPFLWLALPVLTLGVFEKIAFHTSYFTDFLKDRIAGGGKATDPMEMDFPFAPGMHLHLGHFLAMPGLWLGLIFAALFLIAAARLRRYREPV
jgi:ABC-2 type transport system permease protein